MRPADDERARRAFGDAVREAIAASDMKIPAIADQVGLTDDAIRRWTRGEVEPAPRMVFAVEAVLQLPAGDLSRHLGFVPVDSEAGVLAAIDADASLTVRDRKVLRTTYRALRS